MEYGEVPGLQEFLKDYPLMAIRPSNEPYLVLKGRFQFKAESKFGTLTEAYALTVKVPQAFPKSLPVVTETGGRIPRDADFHINGDGTLCLGSPIRLLFEIAKRPTLVGFAELCLVPYLFAISLKIREGKTPVFGELPHRVEGLIVDYSALLQLPKPQQVLSALRLLTTKKRIANKLRCPCNCGKRLGECRFNRRLAKFRKIAPRSWYRQHYLAIAVEYNKLLKSRQSTDIRIPTTALASISGYGLQPQPASPHTSPSTAERRLPDSPTA